MTKTRDKESRGGTGLVSFVGAGPGAPDLITLRGLERIQAAKLVLYAGSLVPREVVDRAAADAHVEDSSGMNLEETHALVREYALAGHAVARVHTGDPSLYGAVREQAALLDRDGIPHEIVPGVTAAFAAAAAANVSFTVPEAVQSLVVTRLPGRTPVPEGERLRDLAAHGCSLAVYLSADKASILRHECLAAGLPADTTVVAAYRVGWPDQAVVRTTLDHVEDAVRDLGVSRQVVFLVLPGEAAGGDAVSRLYDAGFAHGFRAASNGDGGTGDGNEGGA